MNHAASKQPGIVSREHWLAARKKLLVKEKALTRMRDELNDERRDLPWVPSQRKQVESFRRPD